MHGLRNIPRTAFLISFLTAVSIGIPLYVNSTFLSSVFGEQYAGFIYTGAAILSLILFSQMTHLLRRLGNFRTMQLVLILTALSLVAIPHMANPFFLAPVFVLYLVLMRTITFHFDVFLENLSENAGTGSIRGLYYTALNFGILVSPLIAGAILTDGDFWKIYYIAAGLLLPIYLLSHITYRTFVDPEYDHSPYFATLKKMLARRDLRNIFLVSLLLVIFFSWMVVYMPIYLNIHLGFSWTEIGTIFTIMLIPFVVLEFPLGVIADTKLGEKELLIVGFVLMGLTTILLSFFSTASLALWAGMLFLTRLGASTVEIMSETYFFKKISARDASFLSIFRSARPLGYTVGPALASLTLIYMDLRYTFIVLGCLMFAGVWFATRLKDTN
jgi:MFS family permease